MMTLIPVALHWAPLKPAWEAAVAALRRGGFTVSAPEPRTPRPRSHIRFEILRVIQRQGRAGAATVAVEVGISTQAACQAINSLYKLRKVQRVSVAGKWRYSITERGKLDIG